MLLSKTTARLLKLFFSNPDKQFYIQEIGRLLRMKPGAFQRALYKLYKEGLLKSEYKANARFFQINRNNHIYSELKSIVFKSVKVCLVVFILFISSAGYAGESDFSLRESIIYAFQNNKDIQLQEKLISVARADIVGAKSNFLPKVNLNYSYTKREKVFAESIFTGFKNDNDILLSLSQSIYNGGANFANLRQAELGLKVQAETLRAKKLDVEFEAKRLYYGLLLALETRRIAQELLDQAKQHYKKVEEGYKHGTASRFDLLQSKVQVSLLVPQLVSAKNDVEYIKSQLNKLLGRKIILDFQPKERLEYAPIEVSEEEFLKTAYLNKPEVVLQQLGVDISKWSIAMAKAGYRPDIGIFAGLEYRSNNTGDIINSRHRAWNSGISVSVPVFEGFSTRAKVDAAKAQYAYSLLNKENLFDQIAVDVRKSCLDLGKALTVINSQKDNVSEAWEALRIAEVSFSNGVGINLDVLDAQTSLAQIQNNLAQGIYDYLMALASIDRNTAKSYLKEEVNEKDKH